MTKWLTSGRKALRKTLWLLLFLLPEFGNAQEGFDLKLSFDQIQDILREGIVNRDPRQRGLGWYHWAHYEDRKFGASDSAFQYLVHSIDLFRSTKDTLAYQRARLDLADWYGRSSTAFVEDAFKMQYEALEFARRSKNDAFEALVLIRLSRSYMSTGDTANMLAFRREFRDKNEVLRDTLLDIAVLKDEVNRLTRAGRLGEALTLSIRSVRLADRLGDPAAIAGTYYNTGYLYYLDHDFQTALRFLREAVRRITYAEETLQRDIYRNMSLTYAELDSMEAAFRFSIRYADLTDAIIKRDRAASNQEAARRVDVRDKSRAIARLKLENAEVQDKVQSQRLLAGLLSLLLIAVSLAMFFMVRDYRHRLHTSKVISDQQAEIKERKIRELEDNLKIETMHSMLEGQEHERERIANDLHDSLGGLLAAAKLQVENLSVKQAESAHTNIVQKIKNLLDETVSETRQISRNLSPRSLVQFGLVNAVKDLTGRASSTNGPTVTFQCFGDFSGLDEHFALVCYRIIQELLQNSLKHAKASEILVQLTRTDTTMALLVEDDGVGYDPDTTPQGMGSGNIAQRVQFLKGDVSLHAAPGQGTSTMITVPL